MSDLISRADAIEAVADAITEERSVMNCGLDMAIKIIKALPSADAVSREVYDKRTQADEEIIKLILEEVKEIMSVVRCKDCKNWREYYSEDEESYCYIDGRTTDSTDYCSWGERRDADEG